MQTAAPFALPCPAHLPPEARARKLFGRGGFQEAAVPVAASGLIPSAAELMGLPQPANATAPAPAGWDALENVR